MLPRLAKPLRVTLLTLTSVVLALFLLGWLQWGCSTANATCPEGFDWTYQASPMGENYMVFANTADVTDELNAIQAAHQTWNADPAIFDFVYGGAASNAAPANDGVNQIRWGTTGGSLATTTVWTNVTTGDIQEADVVFSNAVTWSTATPTPAGQFDIESVMLHEFGHMLGLDHSNPPAIMQPTIPSATQRRALNADDQNGVRGIYGPATVGTARSIVFLLGFVVLIGALAVLYSRRRELVEA